MTLFRFIIIVLVVCLLGSCVESERNLTIMRKVDTQDPEKSALRISNPTGETAQFTMKLNGLFFHDKEDLKTYVEQTKPAKEPLEMSAWRFVKDHTYFEEQLTDKNWIHGSAIFLNSLGFGYCDDKAAALSYLWEKLGLFSRVWNLGGHVVPEVHDGERWRMYDPEYEVYYRAQDNTIASVGELMNAPERIRYGYLDTLPCNNIHGLWNRYSYKTADMYYTAVDNAVNDSYSELLEEYEFEIEIPAGGLFEFPGTYETPLLNFNNDTIKSYANAKLTIPKSWQGSIQIPLVVHSLRGKGSVQIDSIKYEIGSIELTELIKARHTFIHEFDLRNLESDVEIIYLINPLLVALRSENELELGGTSVSNLEVDLVTLTENEVVKLPDHYKFPSDVYDIKWYINNLPKYAGIPITKVASIKSKLMLVVTSGKDINQEEVTRRYNLIAGNTDTFFAALSPQVNTAALFEDMNDNVNFAVFISLMEHFPPEELAQIINGNTHLKNHGAAYEQGI